MPYLRPGSRFYQCRRRALPGYGDTGHLDASRCEGRAHSMTYITNQRARR